MNRKLGILLGFVSCLVTGLVQPSITLAQSATSGCTLQQIGGTSRHRITCRDGLSLVSEKGAEVDLLSRSRDGRVDTVRVGAGAVLLETTPERAGPELQVTTPQAIAAVRGTRWAVDVAAAKTSVFVLRGRVEVRRRGYDGGVSLGPGEGVDVTDGDDPLSVRRWGRARVNALLGRLGQ